MKKLITLMLCITIFGYLAKATNFYVDLTNGNDTGKDGLSWVNAVKTLSQAVTLAKTAPYDGTVDNIFVKQGTMSFTVAKSYVTNDNIYGSCIGNETSPEQRPMIDLDGNGIIEPWEFQYPTIFTSNLAATSTTATVALTLSLTNSTFNGFTITHNPNSSTYLSKNIYCSISTTTFENNIVKNCNNTSAWTTTSQLGLIMQAYGTVKNCLFEKNQVYVTSVMNASALSPFLSLTTGTKVLNCVFRNNKVTIDYSTASSTNSSAGLKGMIVNAESAASGISTIANSLVYNNESIYIPGTGTLATLTNAATVSLSGTTGAANTDSIINCTIANNKTTKMTTAGLSAQKVATLANYIVNNTLWNNQNDGSVKNITVSSTLTTGLVANNVYNAGSTGLTATPTYVVNNLSNLDNSNTTLTYGPQFKSPTTVIGSAISTIDSTSIKQAVWTLLPGTYLIAKGITTTRLTDKAGNNYASAPAAGAYEYQKVTPIISWTQDLTGFVTNNNPLTIALTATSNADANYVNPITYSSSDETIIAISGSSLVIQGNVGSATITAHQASNTYYNAATDVPNNANVAYGVYTKADVIPIDNKITINPHGIEFKFNGFVNIISYNGQTIYNTKTTAGQFLNLAKGAYIIHLTTETGVTTQKIVI